MWVSFYWSEVRVTQLCPTLCDPMYCSLSGSAVHGVSQAIIIEWVAISFSRGSFQLRDQTQVSCTASIFFTIWFTREVHDLTLEMVWWFSCWVVFNSINHMDYSPLGSSVNGIFQTRIPEWVSISFSRGSPRPRNRTQVSCIAGRLFTNWAITETLVF